MKIKNNKNSLLNSLPLQGKEAAFTLVELIVVITILAILWTIAFISLQWYSADSRDSVRLSDTWNMKTTLELNFLDSGKYPLPDDEWTLTYSWNILFYQWYFGETVRNNVSRNMAEIPTDPLTDKRYIYSVSNNRNELEILTLLEWDSISLNSISETTAANTVVTPRITWNYNGLFVKTDTHIVPLPSIINTEATSWEEILLDWNNIQFQFLQWFHQIQFLDASIFIQDKIIFALDEVDIFQFDNCGELYRLALPVHIIQLQFCIPIAVVFI